MKLRKLNSGQATIEYALVILGAAAIATLLIVWATKSDLIQNLFESVFNNVIADTKE
jgi:hypothetical protein